MSSLMNGEAKVSGKVFTIFHTVYFNETNTVGGVVYFSNYIKWQGMTREAYFIQTVPSWRDIMAYISRGELNMITVEEHSHFIQHAFFGDKICIKLQTTNIKRFSFDMIFTMENMETHKLLYEGIQRLAFDNFKGKFVEIPQPMLSSVKDHEMDPADLKTSRLRKYLHLEAGL